MIEMEAGALCGAPVFRLLGGAKQAAIATRALLFWIVREFPGVLRRSPQ